MFKIVILICSIAHGHAQGCGPGKFLRTVDIGLVPTEGECFTKGYAEAAKQPVGPDEFAKVICSKE